MRVAARIISASVVLCMTVGLNAQLVNSPSEERALALKDVQEVPGKFTNPSFPAKCGPDGSIYVRLFNGGTNMPPTRISADGKNTRTFGLEGTPYFGHSHVWDFAPSSNGGVYQLIWYQKTRDYRLLSFDRDGRLAGDALLSGVPFDPLQIAAFENGTLVVAGRKANKQGGHRGEPGMAIINDQGRLLTLLKLQRDLQPPKAQVRNRAKNLARAPRGSPEQDEQRAEQEQEKMQEEYDSGLDLSTAVSADDGNVYVLRRSPKGPLFQISPAGVVRSIELPDHDNGIVDVALIAHRRLLLRYVREEDMRLAELGLYSEYDIESMNKIDDYRVEETSPIANTLPACYQPNQITFLKFASRGRLYLLTAKLQ